MSVLEQKRYKLFSVAGYWSDEYAQELGDVYMSSMPSKDDIFDALRKNNQFEGLSKDYIDGLTIDRPNGWNYKVIKIYAYGNKDRFLWKFEPAS